MSLIEQKITPELETQLKLINIPQIENADLFERNSSKAYEKDLEHCPVCGKGIPNAQYFIFSAYGGSMYIPLEHETLYANTWVMGIGSECRKKLPKGYVFTAKEIEEINK